MAGPGAPLGNQNAAKAKRWSAAIERALARKGKDAQEELDRMADEFIAAVLAGNSGAMAGWKEFGDRLEGKPAQTIDAKVEGGLTVTIASTDVGL